MDSLPLRHREDSIKVKELGFLLPGEVLPESNPRATGEDSGEVGDKVDVYPAENSSYSQRGQEFTGYPLPLSSLPWLPSGDGG